MNYSAGVICAKCKGACCKRQSGANFPEDFNIANLPVALVEAFKSGNWAIDWWEGDPTGGSRSRTYFVRPALNGADRLFDPTWGGASCIFLGVDGCELSLERRLKGCRELEPKIDGECVDHSGSKRAAAIAWMPYEDIILAAVAQVTDC